MCKRFTTLLAAVALVGCAADIGTPSSPDEPAGLGKADAHQQDDDSCLTTMTSDGRRSTPSRDVQVVIDAYCGFGTEVNNCSPFEDATTLVWSAIDDEGARDLIKNAFAVAFEDADTLDADGNNAWNDDDFDDPNWMAASVGAVFTHSFDRADCATRTVWRAAKHFRSTRDLGATWASCFYGTCGWFFCTDNGVRPPVERNDP